MFRKNWIRAALVLTVLASLLVAPLFASAQTDSGFTAPTDGATVSGTATITGNASSPNFLRWDLFVFPGGNDGAKAWVASGDTEGEFSVDLDTTKFPDGDHALALRVVKTDSNYDEYLVNVTLANAGAPAAAPAEEPVVEATEAVTETVEAPAATPAEAAPVNGFDVEDGVQVSDTVTVTGYANTTGFVKWQLDVVPFGNADDAIFAAYGEEAGKFSYSLDTTQFPDGDHQLRLRVVNDTGNYDEYFVDVTVANGEAEPVEVAATAPVTETATTTETVEAPAATPAPEAMANGITAPADGATVSGMVEIMGNASDPNFLRWDLFILPGGDEAARSWLASGDSQGEFSYELDSALLADGEYTLSVRVVKLPTADYTEYTSAIVIANAAE